MGIPLLSGTRGIRLGGLAVVLTLALLYFVYQAPLSVTNSQYEDALHLTPEKHGNGDTHLPVHGVHDGHVSDQVDDKSAEEEEVIPPTPPLKGVVDEAIEDQEPDTLNFPVTALVGDPAKPTDETEPPSSSTSLPADDPPQPTVVCESFQALQNKKQGPLSEGRREFPYVRPPPECRTFQLPAMEAMIERMKTVIKDPDLFRLFENSFPNTLDTMVKWRGYANKANTTTEQVDITDEELTYVITGDIDAMWLRDSASQIYSYLHFLEPSTDKDSLASLWRGLINSHSRYIVISPYCHSFQPPEESGIPPTTNGAYSNNHPNPPYNPTLVFDCKWELDSLASFLQISTAYYTKTDDLDFFGKYQWVEAVRAAVDASAAMRLGTYDEDGKVLPSAWTFTGWTSRGSETLTNDGLGNPVKENGMVRSGFRPSDDACIFQLLTPSNMMFAAYLEQASVIMEGLAKKNIDGATNLTTAMRDLASGIREGIARDAVVHHRDFGDIFAYEVDGYGSANLMDDANVPSLLAFPLWNYTHSLAPAKPKIVKSVHDTTGSKRQRRQSATLENTDSNEDKDISDTTDSTTTTTTTTTKSSPSTPSTHDYALIYQNTRKFILSTANPYYAQGPALSAVGGPHLGPGKGWPMAAIVAALTAYNDELSGFGTDPKARDEAVAVQLGMVLNSTAGTGVIHESVNAWSEGDWSRSWFGWANGIFGELILRIAEDEERRGVEEGEGLLGRMWQD